MDEISGHLGSYFSLGKARHGKALQGKAQQVPARGAAPMLAAGTVPAEAAANHLQNEYLKLLSMLLCFHARDVRSSKVFEGLTGSWLKHLPLLFIIRILQVKTNAMQCNAMQSSAVALADTLKKHCINLIKSANCLPCISPLETSNKVVACTIGTTSLTLPYYE